MTSTAPIPIIAQIMVGVTTGAGGSGGGGGGGSGGGGAFSVVRLHTGLQPEVVGSMPLTRQNTVCP